MDLGLTHDTLSHQTNMSRLVKILPIMKKLWPRQCLASTFFTFTMKSLWFWDFILGLLPHILHIISFRWTNMQKNFKTFQVWRRLWPRQETGLTDRDQSESNILLTATSFKIHMQHSPCVNSSTQTKKIIIFSHSYHCLCVWYDYWQLAFWKISLHHEKEWCVQNACLWFKLQWEFSTLKNTVKSQ